MVRIFKLLAIYNCVREPGFFQSIVASYIAIDLLIIIIILVNLLPNSYSYTYLFSSNHEIWPSSH